MAKSHNDMDSVDALSLALMLANLLLALVAG